MPYDIFDLYNISDKVEDAAAGVLTSLMTTYFSAAGVQIVTSRDLVVKATPRIELSFSQNNPLQQRTTAGQAATAPKQVPNAFQFTLAALVATTRPVSSNNADIHGRLVGAVLYGLSAANHPFGNSNLPLYQILDMTPGQVGPRVQHSKSQDQTLIQFQGALGIHNGAWLVPQPPTPPTPGP